MKLSNAARYGKDWPVNSRHRGATQMSTTLVSSEVSKIDSFIANDFESYRREASLNAQDSNAEYYGYRVNPNYVARRIALHKGITLDELRRDDVIAAIHIAAENEWIYKDRENRG